MAVDLVHGNRGDKAFAEQVKLIDRLLESRVDGILLLPVNEEASPLYFKEVVDRHIPLVLVDRNTTHFAADFVGTDDFAGGREAARVLAKNGCKRALLISAGDYACTSRLRAQGFRARAPAPLRWPVPGLVILVVAIHVPAPVPAGARIRTPAVAPGSRTDRVFWLHAPWCALGAPAPTGSVIHRYSPRGA